MNRTSLFIATAALIASSGLATAQSAPQSAPQQVPATTQAPAATDSMDIAPAEEPDHFQYTEETWDAGLSVSYTFQRRYTVSVSYRYADYQSDYDLDYDEHRVLLSLTATSDIFRW